MKEVSEKITERIRKLIRLKESATQIGSEGEAHAAAAAVHRLLMEYNLSLLDLAGENPQNRLTACESDRISYKDAAGNMCRIEVEKNIINQIAITNPGTALNRIELETIIRSSLLSRRSDSHTPSTTEIGTVMTITKIVNATVLPK